MLHPRTDWIAAGYGVRIPEPWARPLSRSLRRLAARLLRVARHLARAAGSAGRPARAELPRIEYHGEAGAPEGALYIDGEYIGRLDVRRL